MVETSLEKGKDSVLGKLRFLALIEVDLQIRMRKELGSDKKELIEKDYQFCKANYDLRWNYSIESVILEKRLIFNNRLDILNYTVCSFPYLKSCYDRQLPNLGSIIEELVGQRRKSMILYVKIITQFK